MFGASTGGILVAAAIWLLGNNVSPFSLMTLGFLWGAFAFPLYSISVAHANDRTDPDRFVMISSVLLLMYGVGAISGPFAAAAFMELFGAVGLFLFAALVHAGFGLYLLTGSLQRKAVGRDQVGEFDDALASALTASRVYEYEHQTADQRSRRP